MTSLSRLQEHLISRRSYEPEFMEWKVIMDYGSERNTSLNCSKSFVPDSEEYLHALGWFGIALLVTGGLITVALYALFFEQVCFTFLNAHRVFRRHIYWISSVYPFMALMSVIATVVPKAHNICSAVKVTYMAIGISHFADLTVLMFGSEEVMLARTVGNTLNLQLRPLCCCCCCLPKPSVTKSSLRMVMLLLEQLPFTQAVYHLTVLILISADIITLGNVDPGGVYLWLSLFNLASFMSGVYALQILTQFSKGYLEYYKYTAKSLAMKTLVMATNLQGLAFDIMANYGAFPCIPPFLPPQVYKQTVENSIYLVEMLVLGSYTYWHYHNRRFLKFNPSELHHTSVYQPRTSVDASSGSCNRQRNASSSTRSTVLEYSLSSISSSRTASQTSITSTNFGVDNNPTTRPVRTASRVVDESDGIITTTSTILSSGPVIEMYSSDDRHSTGIAPRQERLAAFEHAPDGLVQGLNDEHEITSRLTVHKPPSEQDTEATSHGEHSLSISQQSASVTSGDMSHTRTYPVASSQSRPLRRYSC
ncbi:organic solute transporter subunit alpha [Procambarus clarkii]|uniref:organic solute transporter subunit alpha n=1 Tax=Procambarus clarkii TaxID=6728 RepID=UPI00374484C1